MQGRSYTAAAMDAPLPPHRCPNCGNRTRFDVYDAVRRRRFVHFSLGGDGEVEEEEILSGTVERVVCRWCDQPAEADPAPPG